MTTMHTGGFGTLQSDEAPQEERTSVLAILSLIFGIVCLPGFGVLGAILGIAAIYFISSAGGRLAGRGLAIAGIVISLLMTFIWIAILWGMVQFGAMVDREAIRPVSTLMQDIDSGNTAAIPAKFAGQTGQQLTEADIAAFAAAYQTELGAYKSAPDGPMQWFIDMMKIGPAMQRFQGRNDGIPIPMTFEKGMALVVLVFDRTSGKPSGSTSEIPMSNLQILTNNGKTINLFDPASRPLAPKAPEAPAAPETPKPAEPEPAEPPK